jgi:hypothetical protein
MQTLTKVALVAAGYLAAGLLATLAVVVHRMATASDAVGSDGMYAFGELLLFIAVFGLVALFPTGAAIYFLRARKSERAKRSGEPKR